MAVPDNVPDRFQSDLIRGRQYIEAARQDFLATAKAEAAACPCRPANLTEALFGAYTCTRCPSYGHKTSDHGEREIVPYVTKGELVTEETSCDRRFMRCVCSVTGVHENHVCNCGGSWKYDDGGEEIILSFPERVVFP